MHEQKEKMEFSSRGAWLGLMAYLLLIAIVTVIYIAG